MIHRQSTKELLANSLIDLASTKTIRKITIHDVTHNCHTGRQTFYNYFNSKEDLITWYYTTQMDRCLTDQTLPIEQRITNSLTVIQQQQTFFEKLLQAYDTQFVINLFYRYSVNYCRQSITCKAGLKALTKEIQFDIQFDCYGCACIQIHWIQSQLIEPASYISRRFIASRPSSLNSFF
ncbi:hypothetical protein UCCLB95_2285 [Levilactobacillus brevis]|uniref:TetR/AcrR family transcriptional regulator C-terminal domain-containing protein n=1 Tax=Levilactobacillus brevis TaxID=1580 RepID=UPI000B36228E|nr:TetR/AcrR family transcriptional regulator C-terminal domain-containing protein [Levilactobacillus brevis]QCZ49487.1 hypothetical protein UCCLB95_2285 [Levilactobacillus brevis]